MNAYRYTVDQNNCLTDVNAAWLAFAQTNDAPELNRQTVLGRSIFDFIAGDESQTVYQAIMDKVRHTGSTPVIPFRCDSPDRRRFMELRVERQPGDHVEFSATLVREERRPHAELLDTHRPTSDHALVICGWCKRFNVDDGWMEVEHAMRKLDLFGWAVMPHLEHGVCDTCSVMLQREISAISE